MSRSERASNPRGAAPAFVLTALACALVAGMAIVRHLAPRPKAADVPASEFSAERAKETLRRLQADGLPHPVGSPEHARVRDRVLAELRRSGYEPSVQETFVCSRDGTCARVANVLARRDGTSPGRAVLLAAHYDSVGAGPGASDDGMGVAAILEVARILKSEPPARNSLLFLIDDGEEAGLLGAEAFTSQHPWAAEVGAVINLEARGSSGASLLFETSDDNRWLIRSAGAALARPNTSSVFYTIYKYLPNDTDLTVFREHGLAGVNFACIGDVAHYHTPLDNVENASAASLQHHGQNALAMARALGEADLAAPHRGNAIFFDLFGTEIASWPEEATLPLAAMALLLVLASIGRRRRRKELLIGEAGWGFVASLAMLFVPVALALAAVWPLRSVGALPTQWVAHPGWLVAMLWVAAALGAGTAAQALTRRAGFWGMWSGVWAFWGFSSLALAWVAPGLSFVFLVPVIAAGFFGWFREPLPAAIPAVAASFFWLPMSWFLYDGLGVKAAALIAAMVALPASTLAPLFSRLRETSRHGVLWALAAAAGILFVAASLSPAFSQDSPERIPIAWHEDADSGSARWLVMPDSGRLPETMKKVASFAPAPIVGFPWAPASAGFSAEGARIDIPPPELIGIEDRRDGTGRRITATVRSPRGAPILFLAFPPPTLPDSVRIGGHKLPPLYPRAARQMGRSRVYSCLDAPPDGVSVEVFFATGRSFELVIGDESYGLPPGGERFAAARPPTSVTSQSGDVSIVTRRVRF
jgi:hypothetical protein